MSKLEKISVTYICGLVVTFIMTVHLITDNPKTLFEVLIKSLFWPIAMIYSFVKFINTGWNL